MKYLIIVVACILFSISHSFAQYGEALASGRPGNANGAGTVGQGILQFQAGVQYDESSYNGEFTDINTSTFSENLVVRFGLKERFEISTVLNYQKTEIIRTFDNEINGDTLNGFTTTMIRARWAIDQYFGIQLGLNLPVFTNDFMIDYASPQIKLMANIPFTENVSLTTNLGAQWDQVSENPYGFYVLSLSGNLPSNFSLILESYGSFARSSFVNSYDVGLGYLVNNDFLLDVNAGWGNNEGISAYFVTAGISYRMVTGFRKQN